MRGSLPVVPISAAGAAATLALALPAAAAQAPTIQANPATVGTFTQVSLVGTTGTGRAGQTVYVQAKECYVRAYRVVSATQSVAGGSWAATTPAEITTAYRARVGGSLSRPTVVRKRAALTLSKLPNTRIFQVRAFGGATLVGRTVRVERLTDSGWMLVQRARLRRSDISGVSVPFGVAETTVRIKRHGLRLRAYITRLEARPCFVAGASAVITS